ncbi:acyl-CoA synthetase [Yinghuangia soli]|uniref:Long-chain fatty acid--CoA ligase n=1 Tax=Yinghuangia soli TaxID=2908204 RepID=A0AA41Q4G3_9ACTN|nr:long-chain fatty acid--CoA ligase [Yinghuangia soli]MCF2531378.1 long-chain fatty acid--CoA ligase [Yinghuangia soli]
MGITQPLHRMAQQNPGKTALVEGDTVVTFGEFRDRTAHSAGALQNLGVAAGDRVAVLSLNSVRYLEVLAGTIWAGAVVNPVNIRWSPVEIAYSLDDSDTRVLFVDDVFAAMVGKLRDLSSSLQTVVHFGVGPTPEGMLSYAELLDGAVQVPDASGQGSDLVGIFYTGGTTGFPKGVMLSHTNLHTSALGGLVATAKLREGDDACALYAAPMFHIAGFGTWVMTSMLGVTGIILPFFEPKAVLEAVERHSVTEVFLVPTMIQMVLDHPDFEKHDMSSVRFLSYGASPISETLLDRTLAALPAARLTQAYGQTEVSPLLTFLMPEDHDERDPKRLRSAGRPLVHTEVRIVDPDDNEVERGVVGEIVGRGDHIMLGYWNRPEETAAALRGGWMHTGDLGFMDEDGYVTVVDRLKDMIVTGAENVYSAEVENALAAHPAVAACAVIGVPDPQWGERVHAVVVLHPGATATEKELRDHAHTLIANYKCPRSVEFVDELPLTAANKVSKPVLRERVRAASLIEVEQASGTASETVSETAPETPSEEGTP